MLEDCRQAPISIFLTLPSTIHATNNQLETAGGYIDSKKASFLYDKWPEILGLGEKMDFVSVCKGNKRSHEIISESLKRNKPISGHIFGREFVSAAMELPSPEELTPEEDEESTMEDESLQFQESSNFEEIATE